LWRVLVEIVSFDELLEMEIEEIPALIGDGLIVPNGRFIMYGPPGAYKSYLIQQLLFAMGSEGVPWFGFDIHERVTTLYIELEVTHRNFQERAQAIRDAFPDANANNVYYAMEYDFTLDGAKAVAELVAAAKGVGAGMVVVDPLNLIMEGSENDDKAIRFVVKALNIVRRETGACVGIVHHSNKGMWVEGNQVDRGLADLSGSKGLGAWADTIIRVIPVRKKPNTIELKWEKVRNGEKPPGQWIKFDREMKILVPSESDVRSVLLKAIENGPMGVKELDTLLKTESSLGINAAIDLRNVMREEGIIEIIPDPENGRKKQVRLAK